MNIFEDKTVAKTHKLLKHIVDESADDFNHPVLVVLHDSMVHWIIQEAFTFPYSTGTNLI